MFLLLTVSKGQAGLGVEEESARVIEVEDREDGGVHHQTHHQAVTAKEIQQI